MKADPFQTEGQDGDTLFRDVLSLALLGFMAIIVLLLPHIVEKKTKGESEISSPGNVIIEITWPNDTFADIDLWVQGPGEVPVGYSNQGNTLFNLLRDDLGRRFDMSSVNYESAFSRGVKPGEYIVNIHAFRLKAKGPLPFDVELAIASKVTNETGVHLIPILTSTAVIQKHGEELTVARFTLDESGALVDGSVNNLFKPLRAGDTKK